MLETWGEYIKISYENRIKSMNQPVNFKTSQRNKNFIPVRYRSCDIKKISNSMVLDWKYGPVKQKDM